MELKTMEQVQAELTAAQARLAEVWTKVVIMLAEEMENALKQIEDQTPIEAEAKIEEEEEKPRFAVGDILECPACGKGKVLGVEDNSFGGIRYDLEGIGKHWEAGLTKVEEPKRPEPKFKGGDWVKTSISRGIRVESNSRWDDVAGTWEYYLRFRDKSAGWFREDQFQAGDPPAPRFQVGSRVQYEGWGETKTGTVTRVELDHDDDYRFDVKFDDGTADWFYDYDFGMDEYAPLTSLEN